VQIDFSLQDASTITSIHCSLDGAAFTTCGSGTNGTILYTQVAPGAHLFEIYGVDQWGNAGRTSAQQISTPPPSRFARLPFTHVAGAGHLVLIGYDYEDRIIILKQPQQQVSAVNQLLINALRQSPAAAYTRGPRIAVFDGNSVPSERTNVRAIIASTYPSAVEVAVGDELPTNIDILVVLDQNGAFADTETAEEIANDVRGPLLAFLNAGGIVIITDGLDAQSNPSQTFRLLHPDLLEIHSVRHSRGNLRQVPCNTLDPLTQGIGQTFSQTNMATYLGPEPWVTYADRVEGDAAVVYHKWFGSVDEGPIGVTVYTSHQGGNVIFQDASGDLVESCSQLDNGTAVHHMGRNSTVSAGRSTDLGSTAMWTYLRSQPLDHLHMGFMFGLIQEPTPRYFGVTLPVLADDDDVNYYVVRSACGEQSTEVNGGSLEVQVCPDEDGTFSLVAEAIACADEAPCQIKAFTIQNGLRLSDQSVTMPAWQPVNLSISIDPSGFGDLESYGLVTALNVGSLDHYQTGNEGWWEYREPGDLRPFIRYSSAGVGSPMMSRFLHHTWVNYEEDETWWGGSERIQRGARPTGSSLSLRLSSILLGRLTDPNVSFDGNGEAVSVTFATEGSLANADGGQVQIMWNLFLKVPASSWTIVFPPGASVPLPPNPGEFPYWPTSFDEPVVSSLRIHAASYVNGYDEYRSRARDVESYPASGDFTLQMTWLEGFFRFFRSPVEQ
jgi:hypothetical protein